MRRILFTSVWLLCFHFGVAQVIPIDRIADWNLSASNHHFVEPDNVVNVLDFGALGDGVTDDYPAIQSAIESFQGRSGIVFFPPGDYLIKSSITLTDSIVLQGESSEFSTLSFQFGQQEANGINIHKSQTGNFVSVTGGMEKGSSSLQVADAATFAIGQTVEIRQENGDWDVVPISWADYSVGQITRIIQIDGDLLMLESPLRIELDPELNPEVRPLDPIVNAGVECLKIVRKDAPDTGPGYNISFAFASQCRVLGVESDSSVGSHIHLTNSANVSIRGNYFHNAFTYDGTGTRGYGVTLSMHTSECLIENNIFKKLRHAMMVKTGSNGNIFSYNYSIEPYRSETIPDFSGDISLHGHYAFANLFEGNIVQNIIVDHYWGSSGPWNTFFRNRAELYGLFMTSSDTTMTNDQNFVGLEIPNTNLPYGLYFLTGQDHFEYGNNVRGNMVPPNTDSLPEASYYLLQKPAFWKNDIWPSIGTPVAFNTGSIPAKDRYMSGSTLTVCPTDSIPTFMQDSGQRPDFLIWPNPATDFVFIRADQIGSVEIQLLSLHGQTIVKAKEHPDGQNPISLTIPSGVKPGYYFLIINQGNQRTIHKLMITKQ